MKPNKLKKMIRKLKALADQGVGGEAENAKRKLDELLDKHGIKLDDVQEQIRTWELTTLNEGSVMLEKVIKSVCPDATINVKQYKSRLTIEAAMSDVDYQEVSYKYKFVWSAYNSDRQLFLTAFLNSNAHLFIPERKNTPTAPSGGGMNIKYSPPTVELKKGEIPMPTEEQRSVGIIMSALKPRKYVKTTRMIEQNNSDT